ncbi:putative histone-lysine N-methyltransferase SUVR2-like [Capsicum annuum]|nr:putative histone-lysine N-methyltransferase SUVR2-like [Capsicum annuum]
MGSWSYPDASLEDLVKMVKGFIDMTILASGHQSSGRLAHWDSQNIKNALQLALFLEHVMRDLSSSDDYRDSLEELDAALCGMISNPYFPQGGISKLIAKFFSKWTS